MNLQDLQNIDLGQDPKSIYTLKGDLLDFYLAPNFDIKGDTIIRIRVKVKYYSGTTVIDSERFKSFDNQHLSENNIMVNAYGQVDENGLVGETDFFIDYTENNLIDFFGSIYNKIIEAKTRGIYYL